SITYSFSFSLHDALPILFIFFKNSATFTSYRRLFFSINEGGILKREWIVWPFTFSAATPVGATTTKSFLELFLKYCRRCDLPVPDRKSTRLNSSHVKISY